MYRLFLITILLTITTFVSSQDESSPAPKRSNLLRRPANRNIFGKASTTTTTTQPPEVEDVKEKHF